MARNGKLIITAGEHSNIRRAAVTSPYDASLDRGPAPRRPPFAMHGSKGLVRRGSMGSLGGGAGAGSASRGGGQSLAQSPLYYDYRWSTPDKFYYPKNRAVANSIFREVYKRDAAVATATDMYAELPWSEFDLAGIDDKHIKHIYEDMFSELNLLPKLTGFTRDYLVSGELVLHNMFDATRGIWNRIIPHNPDYVRAEGIGLVAEQPLLWLLPTPEIKRLLNSTDPRIRQLQKILPKEVVNAFRANKEVPLDPLNTTFLARQSVSTDVRGTSLYSRIYRIIMYEDFLVNAALAVAQRNAAPLRIFKLGDPTTGWLPDEDDEAAFAEMLSMAESDPLGAIIMHHNVSAELVGVSDRMLSLSKEWDFIERVKLIGLGVSKSFLVGEASFASSVVGMQTLLQRLFALRMMFENQWMIRKICKPIAQIHEFYKRTPAELEHRIRIKKPLDEVELILPKIKWKKTLESLQDVAILNVWRDLKERGVVSDRTYAMGAGVDIESERKNISEERTYKQEHPEIYGIPGQQAPQSPMAGPPGKPGKPPAPGMPPASKALKEVSKKRAGYNPYLRDRHISGVVSEISDAISDGVEEYTNKEGMIHADDVAEVVDDALAMNSENNFYSKFEELSSYLEETTDEGIDDLLDEKEFKI